MTVDQPKSAMDPLAGECEDRLPVSTRVDLGTIAHRKAMYASLLKVREYFLCLEDALNFSRCSELRREIDGLLEQIHAYHPIARPMTSPPADEPERRHYRRHSVKGNVSCIVGGDERQVHSGKLICLSLNGAMIVMGERLDTGTELDLQLTGSDHTASAETQAVVRRVATYQQKHWIGCEFVKRIPFTILRRFIPDAHGRMEWAGAATRVEEIDRIIQSSS